MMASKLKYNSDDNIFTNTNLHAPYAYRISIHYNRYIPRYIYGNITKQIKNATAISLRSDGNVDRTHVDKIYILAKVIDKVGNESFIFLGLG